MTEHALEHQYCRIHRWGRSERFKSKPLDVIDGLHNQRTLAIIACLYGRALRLSFGLNDRAV